MSGTNYIASNWRVPENSNSSKNDNYSLSFDGSSDVLTWGQTDLPAAHTISFWVKMGGLSTDYRTILIDTTYAPSTPPVRRIYLRLGRITYIDTTSAGSTTLTTTNDVGTILTDGDWHHVVVVRNDTVGTIYIDNVNKTDDAAIGSLTTPFYLTRTGETITSYGSIFIGDLSDISFFDYALDSSQISTLYGDATSGAGNPMSLKPTPVAYYPLGDNSASNPLTQPNVSVDDASVFDFDFSSSQYIDAGNPTSLQITGALTISTWVKMSSTSGGTQDCIISKDNGSSQRSYTIWGKTTSSSSPIAYIWNGGTNYSVQATTNIEDDNWHHVMLVYVPSTSLNIYIDGVLEGSNTTSIPSSINNANQNFNIGRLGNATFYYTGQISNVVLWSSDQSSEISNIYNSGVPATSYTNTPVAWWKLDQSANWEADTSGNWQIPDAVSAYPQSFSFNGSNQYIPIGSTSLGITSVITVSAWVKIPTTNTGGPAPNIQEFICEDNTGGANRNWALNWRHQSVSNKYFSFAVFHTDGSVTSIQSTGIVPNDGNWHHVMGTFDGTTDASGLKLYVDGTLFQTTAVSTGIRSTSGVAPSIGAIENGSAYRFEGNLSNIAVWDSVQNIDDIYNSGTPAISYSGTPTAWWKLDNTATFSTNWSVPDASGNGNDGTSSGMTEQSLVNNNVSTLNGESSGMTSGNLVLSDLTRNLPYENYSLDFDAAQSDYIDCGTNVFTGSVISSITISIWIKTTVGSANAFICKDAQTSGNRNFLFQLSAGDLFWQTSTDGINFQNLGVTSGTVNVVDGEWHHIVGTYESGSTSGTAEKKIYIDGILRATDPAATLSNIVNTLSVPVEIGRRGDGFRYFDGNISNASIFDVKLTSTEVLKLYANGLPQDLTNFTPQPISWWTLGKESFWNGSDWIVRDMIGSNDGTGQNIALDDLVGNAPRSEANGTGTNMDIPTNLVGNAGFSDKNAYSINMSPSARVTDTP